MLCSANKRRLRSYVDVAVTEVPAQFILNAHCAMLGFFDNKIVSRVTQPVTLQANIDKYDYTLRSCQNRIVTHLTAGGRRGAAATNKYGAGHKTRNRFSVHGSVVPRFRSAAWNMPLLPTNLDSIRITYS